MKYVNRTGKTIMVFFMSSGAIQKPETIEPNAEINVPKKWTMSNNGYKSEEFGGKIYLFNPDATVVRHVNIDGLCSCDKFQHCLVDLNDVFKELGFPEHHWEQLCVSKHLETVKIGFDINFVPSDKKIRIKNLTDNSAFKYVDSINETYTILPTLKSEYKYMKDPDVTDTWFITKGEHYVRHMRNRTDQTIHIKINGAPRIIGSQRDIIISPGGQLESPKSDPIPFSHIEYGKTLMEYDPKKLTLTAVRSIVPEKQENQELSDIPEIPENQEIQELSEKQEKQENQEIPELSENQEKQEKQELNCADNAMQMIEALKPPKMVYIKNHWNVPIRVELVRDSEWNLTKQLNPDDSADITMNVWENPKILVESEGGCFTFKFDGEWELEYSSVDEPQYEFEISDGTIEFYMAPAHFLAEFMFIGLDHFKKFVDEGGLLWVKTDHRDVFEKLTNTVTSCNYIDVDKMRFNHGMEIAELKDVVETVLRTTGIQRVVLYSSVIFDVTTYECDEKLVDDPIWMQRYSKMF